jgi:hypothetical protein
MGHQPTKNFEEYVLEENYIMRSSVICTPTQYCAGGKIEKNDMGGACGAYGGGERCAQSSGGET